MVSHFLKATTRDKQKLSHVFEILWEKIYFHPGFLCPDKLS